MLRGTGLRWCFNCRRWSPSKDDFLLALSCIQEEERERVLKFYFKKDLKLALIGRLLLRKCISQSLDIPYDSVKLIRSEKGKPILEDCHQKPDKPFDFNVSHDGDYCVLAADSLSKVGVDVTRVKDETTRPIEEYFKTMERTFSPQEWTYIKDSDRKLSQQQSPLFRFHRLWALKESFVKAEAIGIGFELRRIIFSCPTPVLPDNQIIDDTQVYLDGQLLNNWIFEESLLDNRHIVCVALSGSRESLNKSKSIRSPIIMKSFDEIVEKNVPLTADPALWDQYIAKQDGKYL